MRYKWLHNWTGYLDDNCFYIVRHQIFIIFSTYILRTVRCTKIVIFLYFCTVRCPHIVIFLSVISPTKYMTHTASITCTNHTNIIAVGWWLHPQTVLNRDLAVDSNSSIGLSFNTNQSFSAWWKNFKRFIFWYGYYRQTRFRELLLKMDFWFICYIIAVTMTSQVSCVPTKEVKG